MIRKTTLITALVALLVPASAAAYLNPEDVLLNRELYLPPSAREANDRTTLQTQESAARREREQDRAFELQHPTPPEPEVLQPSAPEQPAPGFWGYPMPIPMNGYYGIPVTGIAAPNTETANLELARTIRLLSRVNQNQATTQLSQVLHSSANDLAPTGAGTVLSLMTLMGAAIWTLLRARNAKAIAGEF